MAKPEIKEEKSVTANNDKTDKIEVAKETTVAPVEEKPIEGEATEAPEAKDISDVLMLLNIMDQEIGGKGEIADVPEQLRGSIGYLVEKLTFVRELFEDPMYMAILDDMADQREDGKTPSLKVAIARNIPLEELQELADSEDYEGVQGELADNLAMKRQTEEEDAEYEANFEASQKAGEEYATEMGYDEAEKNALFQLVLDLFKIMGDGKLTVEEFRKVDKMRNYDKDLEDVRSQIPNEEPKEVLPDQASIDATISATKKPPITKPTHTPGMGSMGYETPAFLNTGQKRFGK